jgi:hypothetical protein
LTYHINWKGYEEMPMCVCCGVRQRPSELDPVDDKRGVCRDTERCVRWQLEAQQVKGSGKR